MLARLILLLALLVSSSTWAAITVVRDTGTPCHATVNNATCSFSTLPAAGNTIVVLISGLDCSTLTMSDNQGGTSYTQAVWAKDTNTGRWNSIMYRENISAPSGTFTITATCSGLSEFNFVGFEVSGLATSGSLDQTASKNPTANWCGAGTDTVGPTSTLAQADEIVFSVAGGRQTSTTVTSIGTPTTGYTLAQSRTGAATYTDSPAGFAYKIVSDTAAVSAVWTCNYSGSPSSHTTAGTIVLATFKQAGAAASANSNFFEFFR